MKLKFETIRNYCTPQNNRVVMKNVFEKIIPLVNIRVTAVVHPLVA